MRGQSETTIELIPADTYAIAPHIQHLVPHSAYPHVTLTFLLDFAIIFLKHIDKEGKLVADANSEIIPVAQDDLLALRELVPVTVGVGTAYPAGMAIHRKIYRALLRLDPVRSEDLPFDDEESPGQTSAI